MLPNDPVLRKQMIDRMIEHCKNNMDKLTKWEEAFIYSIDNKESLSDRECEKLEEIHDRV